MARKDFQKGMEAGAKPFEEKFRQQEDAVRRVGNRLDARLDDISAIQDVILDDLSAREKKELYDLNTLVDIKDFEEAEREFLMAILYTLADMTEEVTEHQQAYIRSVKKYLDIKDVQSGIDLSCIENIDSKRETKAVLQTVMEFLFLENCNHDYQDEYEDILDYFDVKASDVRKIQKAIDTIFRATGATGLAEKFGFVPLDTTGGSNYSGSIAVLTKEKFGELLEQDMLFSLLPSINGSVVDMNYCDDGIHSKSEAKRQAERRFRGFYRDAEEYLDQYSSKSLSRTATDKCLSIIKNDIIEISDAIRSLDNNVLERNKLLFEELGAFIDLRNLEKRISELAEAELNDHYYSLTSESYYLGQIEYTETDSIDGGLFRRKDWWYDGMNAYMDLEKDLTDKAYDYAKYVSKEFIREVITPLLELVERIK